MQWLTIGNCEIGVFRLADAPKEVWVRPNGFTNALGEPILNIVGFEGVGLEFIGATPGEK
jgi:hypothetical protein